MHSGQRHNKDRWRKKQRTVCATEPTSSHFLIVTVSRSHFGIFHCTGTLPSETAHVTRRERDPLIHARNDGENKSWCEPQSPHNASSCSLRRLTSAIDPLRGRFLTLRCSAGLHLLSLTLSAVNKGRSETPASLSRPRASISQSTPSRDASGTRPGGLKSMALKAKAAAGAHGRNLKSSEFHYGRRSLKQSGARSKN